MSLPDGWSEHWSKTKQHAYYYNEETDISQWERPVIPQTPQEPPVFAPTSPDVPPPAPQPVNPPAKKPKKSNSTATGPNSVAIIVPYRDLHVEQKRAAHLQRFVPYMSQFLEGSSFHIYIIEQSDDDRKFNRGKLLNIGFEEARGDGHEIFVFHDVDLLPSKELKVWYKRKPTQCPLHMARVWKRYSNNPKYIGGVVSYNADLYQRINGYPNNYWGWGGEDDEMQRRLEHESLVFEAPTEGSYQDLEEMELSTKLDFLRQHKEWKCMVKWELAKESASTWKQNGLSNLKYEVLQRKSLSRFATKVTVDVQLNKGDWTNERAGADLVS